MNESTVAFSKHADWYNLLDPSLGVFHKILNKKVSDVKLHLWRRIYATAGLA